MIVRPLSIVVDIDGCLANWNTAMWQLLALEGALMRPFELPEGEPRVWDWLEAYGASPAQIARAVAYQTPYWWGSLLPHRDFTRECIDVLRTLCCHHEVTCVTSRPQGCRNDTADWLNHYVNEDTDCHVVLTPGDKVGALVAMRPDVIVEDRAQTLADYAAHEDARPATLLLVDRPYNREPGCAALWLRIPSTLAALTFIAEEMCR